MMSVLALLYALGVILSTRALHLLPQGKEIGQAFSRTRLGPSPCRGPSDSSLRHRDYSPYLSL
jgi:hypothetical protein